MLFEKLNEISYEMEFLAVLRWWKSGDVPTVHEGRVSK
jgi:hypothetical protein